MVDDLPRGWVWTTLENVAAPEKNAIVDGPFGSNLRLSDYIDGDDGVPVLSTKNLSHGYSREYVRFISREKFEQLRRSEVRAGDILVAKIGSCGKTGIYPVDMPPALIPANLLKMTVHPSLVKIYVYYFLNSPTFKDELDEIITATAQPAFNVSKFRKLSIPLAPLPEQHRIVAEIEKQFTRLEAGIVALKRAQVGLKRYKAAVLKAACEGRLVPQDPSDEPASELLKRILAERRVRWEADLRAKGKDPKKAKYEEPKSPDIDQLRKLPSGWCWASVEQLAEVGTGATPLRSKPKYYEGGAIPWVTSGVVNEFFVDHADEYITEIALQETNAKVFPAGTLLVAMYGEGKTRGKVSELRIDAATNQACAALLFDGPRIQSKSYVKVFFLKNYEDIRRLSSGGVQPNLNLSIIKHTPIPLPPLAEQRHIVAEVERRLSVVQELEASIAANLARSERLRQSVLKRAFEGRLVSQNPDDEPADMLLERIRANRRKTIHTITQKRPSR